MLRWLGDLSTGGPAGWLAAIAGVTKLESTSGCLGAPAEQVGEDIRATRSEAGHVPGYRFLSEHPADCSVQVGVGVATAGLKSLSPQLVVRQCH